MIEPTVIKTGEVVTRGNTQSLTAQIQAANTQSKPAIILDLTKCHTLDAHGLGVIVRGFVHAQEQRGKLVLLGASDRVRRLFQITSLLEHLDVADHHEEALAKLKRPCYCSGN